MSLWTNGNILLIDWLKTNTKQRLISQNLVGYILMNSLNIFGGRKTNI